VIKIKVFIVFFALVVSLGSLPSDIWDKLNQQEQRDIITIMSADWVQLNDCKTVIVEAEDDGEDVEFYITCKEWSI
jgi:hypothetical protein